MARSTGLPNMEGIVGIAHVIGARTSSVTVSRVTESTGTLDETTETESDHTEEMWLYDPMETVANEIAGERVEGSLGALVLADGTVDLERNDRVTHGGVEYEIDTIVGQPDDSDPEFYVVSFVRRQ